MSAASMVHAPHPIRRIMTECKPISLPQPTPNAWVYTSLGAHAGFQIVREYGVPYGHFSPVAMRCQGRGRHNRTPVERMYLRSRLLTASMTGGSSRQREGRAAGTHGRHGFAGCQPPRPGRALVSVLVLGWQEPHQQAPTMSMGCPEGFRGGYVSRESRLERKDGEPGRHIVQSGPPESRDTSAHLELDTITSLMPVDDLGAQGAQRAPR
ncbi:hypothetical protein BJ166DRAFT_236970 [Pestalotiopsis sp. NC0098]|nr:hypothetical protein BJ166DRAFT_236970 [Pestalotiopsis sp. NC0098]